MMSPNNL